MRLLSEIHETTPLYPPAGGKQGPPPAPRTPCAPAEGGAWLIWVVLQPPAGAMI